MRIAVLMLLGFVVCCLSACSSSSLIDSDGDIEMEEEVELDLTEDNEENTDGDFEAEIETEDENAEMDLDGESEEEVEEEEGPVVIAFSITKGSHTIVLREDASASEIRATNKLQEYLNAVLGDDIQIINQATENDSPMIVIGLGDVAKSFGVDPSGEELEEQGYVIKTTDKHVIIAGTQAAGTMYGVEKFMERVVGVRWYAPGVTHVPSLSQIDVPEKDEIVKPAFKWRHTSYSWPGKDDEFLANMTDNSGDKDASSEYGVEHDHDGRAHSYFRFIDPDEYFDEHPEYFSEIGGVRVKEETQLCLTNPDVLDIVTEKMLQRMEASPHVRQHNFSQMDHYNNCTCDKCKAMNEKYKTQGGTQFWFVNQLAERTSKVYPDKLIGTLAYMYTEEPPVGLDMHPNVAVWLCHMFPSCDSHPIDTCELDAEYKRRAESWAELTNHLYIWHYIVDFMHYYNPFPNFRAMSADMRLYKRLGVEGIYLQGMGHSGGGGEWSLLRPYYGMQLLWNPDLDPKALRRDFLQGYYGDAWQPLENYIEMLHDKVEDEHIHMHLYTNPAQGYLTDEVMAAAWQYFDEAALAVEDDDVLFDRVEVARMPLFYADSFPRSGYEIKDGKVQWLNEIITFSDFNNFVKMMDDHGFTTSREVAGDTNTLTMLYMLIAAKPSVKTISNSKLEIDIVTLLGGRALRIKHLDSDEYITAYNVKENLYFPFAGGLEDRTGEIFRYYGWVEPAEITSQTESSMTLEKETLDGWKLKRTMSLRENQAIIDVVSEITNPADSGKEMEGRLRSHLELNLGDLNSTKMQFTSLDGGNVNEDMTEVIANLREGKHFYDQTAPDGEWSFSGSKGLKVVQRFDNNELDFTWVYSYPNTLNEVELELWSKRTMLQPGESIQIKQEIEIIATK